MRGKKVARAGLTLRTSRRTPRGAYPRCSNSSPAAGKRPSTGPPARSCLGGPRPNTAYVHKRPTTDNETRRRRRRRIFPPVAPISSRTLCAENIALSEGRNLRERGCRGGGRSRPSAHHGWHRRCRQGHAVVLHRGTYFRFPTPNRWFRFFSSPLLCIPFGRLNVASVVNTDIWLGVRIGGESRPSPPPFFRCDTQRLYSSFG